MLSKFPYTTYKQSWDAKSCSIYLIFMYQINENIFNNFTLIVIKTALTPGKWLKDSKYVLIFEIGWWEVGFYSPLTDRQTDGQTNRRTDL